MLLVTLIAGAWLLIAATTIAVCVLAARGDALQQGDPVPGTTAPGIAPDTDLLAA